MDQTTVDSLKPARVGCLPSVVCIGAEVTLLGTTVFLGLNLHLT